MDIISIKETSRNVWRVTINGAVLGDSRGYSKAEALNEARETAERIEGRCFVSPEVRLHQAEHDEHMSDADNYVLDESEKAIKKRDRLASLEFWQAWEADRV